MPRALEADSLPWRGREFGPGAQGPLKLPQEISEALREYQLLHLLLRAARSSRLVTALGPPYPTADADGGLRWTRLKPSIRAA
jgi:hypothetical protein